MTRLCPNGHEVSEGQRFCPECGAALTRPNYQGESGSALPEPPVLASKPERATQGRRRAALLIGVIAVIVLAGVAIVVVLATGDEDSPAVPGAADSDHVINGTFELLDEDVSSSCVGSSGYDDIRPGSSVTVRSETGETIATTELDSGEFFDGIGCEYTFTVGVPDARFYRIEVSHRGEVEFSKAELEANDWEASLSLGS
jgi:hypothetical protein